MVTDMLGKMKNYYNRCKDRCKDSKTSLLSYLARAYRCKTVATLLLQDRCKTVATVYITIKTVVNISPLHATLLQHYLPLRCIGCIYNTPCNDNDGIASITT
jgi:hypothetical protein